MARIALLLAGCFLAFGLADACAGKPWHSDWNTCPARGDPYRDVWLHCKEYPEDNPCQLCQLPRNSPQQSLLLHCLLNPNDRQCERYRPTRPIRGSGSRERRRGSGSRERRRGSKSRERRRGSKSRERRRGSGSRSRERYRRSGSKEKKYGKKCKK